MIGTEKYEKEMVMTADGSHSIALRGAEGITYHSRYGAIQESLHVFIEAGLRHAMRSRPGTASLSIFEIGFGTGLNALLTMAEAEKSRQPIVYEALEPYPLEASLFGRLNYCHQLQRPDWEPLLRRMHECDWNRTTVITPCFSFTKRPETLESYAGQANADVIYFDAFAPDVQPGLWTAAAFSKILALMQNNGVLTTYCSKSIVRMAMTDAGFRVEKIPGPPHKREMVRAIKYIS